MGRLLMKELKLAMHPITPVMLLLAAMALIPNYPFVVMFFYVGMAVFFTCLKGRENRDVEYTLSLPVSKRALVRSRILFAALTELAQLVLLVPFVALAGRINPVGNEVGMDANLALFAVGFISYGLFNLVFFASYYKDVTRVDAAFIKASAALAACTAADIILCHAAPFVRDVLDTPDPAHLGAKLAVVAAAAIAFAALTLAACRMSERNFEAQDV